MHGNRHWQDLKLPGEGPTFNMNRHLPFAMMIRSAILFLFIGCFINVWSQNVEIDKISSVQTLDSLQSLLNNSETTKQRQDSLIAHWHLQKGSTEILQGNLKAGIFHLQQADSIARGVGFYKIEAKAKLHIADRLRVQQLADSARDLVSKVFVLADKNQDRKMRGDAHHYNARILDFCDENAVAAMAELHKAKAIFDELNDQEGLAHVHLNIGILHRSDNNERQALFHYQIANKYFLEVGTITDRIRMAINIGTMYHFLGRLDSAENFFRSADELIVDKNGMATAFLNVNYGNALIDMNKFGEAYLRLKKSNEIFTRLEDKYGMAITEYHMGEALLDSGEYRLAIPILQGALDAMVEYGINNMQETVFKDLAKAHAGAGNFERAYDFSMKRMHLFDSLDQADIGEQLGVLQKKYELSLKESENERLLHEAQIREAEITRQQELTIIALLIILGLSGFAAYVYRAQQQAKNLSQTIQKQSDKLEATNSAKSQLFANISHDFRTPLTLISGQVQLLLDDYKDVLPNDALSRLHKISWNNNRLISLTEEIRELISLDSGNIKIDKQPTDLNSFLSLQVGLFQSAAAEKGITMSQDFRPARAIADIDPFKMEKVFYNLLSNALKFTQKEGTIEVSMIGDEHNLVISVSDTGIGIPQEHIHHIFDRYYQIETKDYKVQQGLGIGLAITKELVELQAGKIQVQSKQGEGTRFNITLPRSKAEKHVHSFVSSNFSDDPSAAVTPKNLQPDPELGGYVLIVDDHPEIRSYVADLLKSKFNVLLAENGWQALEVLKQNRVDVVVTDIMMPVMDGFVLIESMKKDDKLRKIPVVAVSARTGQEDKERVLALGVSDYVIKPFNSNEFVLRVSNLVEMRKKDQELPESLQQFNLEQLEEEWLTKLSAIVKKYISEKISNHMLAHEMAVGERTLYRVLKDLTGLTPLEYVKQVKFQYARKLLTEGKVKSLNEAGKAIGIANVTRFKSQYRAYYDEEPVASPD